MANSILFISVDDNVNSTTLRILDANLSIPRVPCNILIDNEVMLVQSVVEVPDPFLDFSDVTVQRGPNGSRAAHTNGTKIYTNLIPLTNATQQEIDSCFASKIKFKEDTNILIGVIDSLNIKKNILDSATNIYNSLDSDANLKAQEAASASREDLIEFGFLTQFTEDLITDAGNKRGIANAWNTGTVIPAQADVDAVRTIGLAFYDKLNNDQDDLKNKIINLNNTLANEIYTSNAGAVLITAIVAAYQTLIYTSKVLLQYDFNNSIVPKFDKLQVPVLENLQKLNIDLIINNITQVGPVIGSALVQAGSNFNFQLQLSTRSATPATPDTGGARLGDKVSLADPLSP